MKNYFSNEIWFIILLPSFVSLVIFNGIIGAAVMVEFIPDSPQTTTPPVTPSLTPTLTPTTPSPETEQVKKTSIAQTAEAIAVMQTRDFEITQTVQANATETATTATAEAAITETAMAEKTATAVAQAEATATAIAEALTAADWQVVSSPEPPHPGQDVTIVANLPISASIPVTYRWKLDGDDIPGEKETITFKAPEEPGIHTVTLEIAHRGRSITEKTTPIEVVEPPPSPPPTPTPTPTPTLEPTPVTLIKPNSGVEFVGKDTIIPLTWGWYRDLEPEEYYFIDAKYTGSSDEGCKPNWPYFKWTKEKHFVVDTWLYDTMCDNNPDREITWTVYVGIPSNPGDLENQDGKLLSALGETRRFKWTIPVSGDGDGDDGGPVGVPVP